MTWDEVQARLDRFKGADADQSETVKMSKALCAEMVRRNVDPPWSVSFGDDGDVVMAFDKGEMIVGSSGRLRASFTYLSDAEKMLDIARKVSV